MPRAIALGAAAIVAAAAAGCGSSSDSPSSTGAARPATTTAPAATFPAEDGKIAFRRYFDDAQTTGAVFTINPDGTGERQVTRPPGNTLDDQPAWSPDGKLIAFTRCPADGICGVWTVRPDGTHARAIFQCRRANPATRACADAANVTFTADGRHLIFTASYGRINPGSSATGGEDQIQNSELGIGDLRGHITRSLVRATNFSADLNWGSFSPDGKTLAYEVRHSYKTKPADKHAVFVLDVDTGRRHRLTDWQLDAGDNIDWSPDGSKLLFRSHQEDSQDSEYFTIRPDGTGLKQLTKVAGSGAYSASWSPDGKYIAISPPGKADIPDIVVMNADGSGQRPVTRTPSWESAPDWGPAPVD
jgi:Tol biopolymer transport system component